MSVQVSHSRVLDASMAAGRASRSDGSPAPTRARSPEPIASRLHQASAAVRDLIRAAGATGCPGSPAPAVASRKISSHRKPSLVHARRAQ